MDSQIRIGITRRYGEYRVFYSVNGRDDEAKACYTNDPQDAVGTLKAVAKSTPNATITDAKYTQKMLRTYGGG
jgi:hypothetical protein